MGNTWLNLTKNQIILLQFGLKHIHKVNFYPSDNNFSAACDACDKYDLWLGNLTKIYQGN